ncbi:putative phosphatase YxeH [Dissostichus eleginoides]|uniref:Phosphatase YxeH n=1 Tax=Dissostichus eleginoides TaxID=100907 RepID=A0AAD9BKP5_DISEL|nr:putative phosphatase YxeH [Dissostichus eleginoides]
MHDEEGDLVAGFISSVLPNSSTNELVLEALREMGVDTLEDLKYVNEADLKNVMRPIDARKLMASVKALSENDASGTPDPPPQS